MPANAGIPAGEKVLSDSSPTSLDPDRPIALAAIAGPHGIAGEVRLKLFADSLYSLKRHRDFRAGVRSLTLQSVRSGANGPVARFAELTTRDAAEALRGAELTVPRSALPPLGEGEYYHCDLIGLPVLADGREVGRVVGVENYGAGDLVEITLADNQVVLSPLASCALLLSHVEIDPVLL